MNTEQLTDREVLLCARALSIHRVAMRRKLDRLSKGTSEFGSTMKEIRETQALIEKLNAIDLDRVS